MECSGVESDGVDLDVGARPGHVGADDREPDLDGRDAVAVRPGADVEIDAVPGVLQSGNVVVSLVTAGTVVVPTPATDRTFTERTSRDLRRASATIGRPREDQAGGAERWSLLTRGSPRR
jgi:hypothetical protein